MRHVAAPCSLHNNALRTMSETAPQACLLSIQRRASPLKRSLQKTLPITCQLASPPNLVPPCCLTNRALQVRPFTPGRRGACCPKAVVTRAASSPYTCRCPHAFGRLANWFTATITGACWKSATNSIQTSDSVGVPHSQARAASDAAGNASAAQPRAWILPNGSAARAHVH